MTLTYVYVIECENNKYYVDIYYSDRILQHGPEQEIIKQNIIKYEKVLKYKPIKIIIFNYDAHNININQHVKTYMRQYGINNVRGGDYSDLELSDKIINKLNFELLGKNTGSNWDYCFHCMKAHNNNNDCLGKNIDTSNFLKDCNDYNTIIIKINYITNYYDKICLLKKQVSELTNNKLDEKYKKYIMNNKDPDNLAELKDDIIKKYELDSLLFDKKLELVNIYKVHKSEYYLKNILEELYKRKLKYMYDSIE